MTKGYTRVASICIAPKGWVGGAAVRAPYEKAVALVTSGRWHFTSKGRWKADGRHSWKE